MRGNDDMDEATMRAIARQEAEKLMGDAALVRRHQIEEIVDTAVKKTLQGFGIDIENPIEVQENFVDLRSWSDLKKAISQGIVATLSKSVTMGIVALLVMGFYMWLTGHKPPP